jgi:DNA-binding NtrC family response regulator
MMNTGVAEIEILIVDDEPDVRRAVKRFLRKSGFHVWTAGAADEALDIIRQRPIAVLLTDIRLTGMDDGLRLLRQVQILCPETVRIVFSAAVAGHELRDWIDTGRIFTYIPKPMDLTDFRRTLRRAVDHYVENRRKILSCA